MKDLDEKYSVRIGITGNDAYEKHEHSDLTMAHLGAIHEFGATIQVTEKMRAYLHHIGIHLKPETTSVVIPTRSFLRMPLLDGSFEQYLMNKIREEGLKIYELNSFGGSKENKKLVREYNLDNALDSGENIPLLMKAVAIKIATEALAKVDDAFQSGGFGKWAPISEVTRENRKGDASNPPLQDTGDLWDSISYEVKGKSFYDKKYIREL